MYGESYLKMGTIATYLGYKLTYDPNKNINNNTSDDSWQTAITNWKGLPDKSFDNYKKYRNTISSLKNRVFSSEEWKVVSEYWEKISNIIIIQDANPIELYEKLTGETRKPDDCLELFKKFEEQKKNGKRFSKPRAEIYRLLAAYNLDKFCPIVNEDNLNEFICLLQEQGYIESIKDKNENEVSPQKLHWCIKSALLRSYFKNVLGDNYKDVTPWGIYKQLKDTEVKEILINNKNLILTGAPGTGKTFMAKKIAEEITGEDDSHIGFAQFHPSYDYTDFVEGLRPDQSKSFERVDGVFKSFCKCAYLGLPVNANLNDIEEKEKKVKEEKEVNTSKSETTATPCYVFIIDEINRGEISKIFGELFFSIDPGYRDDDNPQKIQTQYQNQIKDQNDLFKDGFFVPKNVFVIGTMNDIDRSVESMDFAFRRRFAFYEVKATGDMLDSLKIGVETIGKLKATMNALNEAVVESGLTEAYQIGAAYFKKIEKFYNSTEYKVREFNHAMEKLWNYHLKGTLYEYYRGEPDADKKMAELKKAYDSALK